LDLSKNDLRSEGLSVVSEALKSTSIKQLNIADNMVTYNQQNQQDMSGVIKFAKDMKDMGSLSKLIFNGGVNSRHGWEEGGTVTMDTTMTEADFSGKKLGPAGAQILVAFMSTKLFEAMGSLSKLTFCGNGGQYGSEGDAVTIDTTMTEADFNGKKLGAAGAQILAAFISTKLFEAKGSLASLDISDNDIGDEQTAKIKQICAGKSIKFTL
jgi:hypothetical protein